MDNKVVVLSGDKSIQKVKSLDDAAFDGYQKISIRELKAIADQSGLLGIFEGNQLVAESQLLLTNTDFYSLEYNHSAYCYGIAVDQKYRGKGFAKDLILAMEQKALKKQKKWLYLASRPENYASLQLWYSHGYHVCDYKERYFGPDLNEDSRLLLRKNLISNPVRDQKVIKSLTLYKVNPNYNIRFEIKKALENLGSFYIEVVIHPLAIEYRICI